MKTKEEMEKMMAESEQMKESMNKMMEEMTKMREDIEKLKKCIGDIEAMNKKLERLMNDKGKVVKNETDHVVRESDTKNTKTAIDTSYLDDLKNSLLESLVSKDDFNYLTKRVESLETLSSSLSKQQDKTNKEIERINERLKALEGQMLDKVSCDQYDELMKLVNMLRSGDNKGATGPVGPMVSSKDLNLIREVASKITDLETRVNTLAK